MRKFIFYSNVKNILYHFILIRFELTPFDRHRIFFYFNYYIFLALTVSPFPKMGDSNVAGPSLTLRPPRHDDVAPYTEFLADPEVSVWRDDSARDFAAIAKKGCPGHG